MSLSKSSSAGALGVISLVVLTLSCAEVMASNECPMTLPPGAIAPNRAPEGWRTQVQREVRLYTAGLIAGDPAEGGYLKPLESKLTRNGEDATVTSTWELGLPRGEIWLYCGYGDAVELFRRIEKTVSKCVMTSKVRGRAVRNMELSCQ